MAVDPNEKIVAGFLSERGFRCVRFSTDEIGRAPTPDFRVYQGADFRFFCEVKTINKDIWLDKQLSVVPPGTMAGGLRDDPTFNRLTSDIHTATKQFDAVNPDVEFPNVLAFVNNESTCILHDLYEVFTGNFRSQDGTLYPISKKYSEGRIREKKFRIHMFIWIDLCKSTHNFMYTDMTNAHVSSLCKWLGKDPKLIKRY